MSYDSGAVANHFLRLAKEEGKSLSNLKLQKLLYYAHGHWLGEGRGPLLNESVQAWRHGPVVGSMYQTFREFGNGPITTRAADGAGRAARLPWDGEGEAVREFVEKVYRKYGRYTGGQLSDRTHAPGTPWAQINDEYKGKLPLFKEIPNDLMKGYFEKRPLAPGLFDETGSP